MPITETESHRFRRIDADSDDKIDHRSNALTTRAPLGDELR